MRASKATSAVFVLASALLSSCGSPTAQLPNPTGPEAVEGIIRLLTASNLSAKVIVPNGQPTQCTPGKLGEVEVRTCKVCAVALYTVNQMFGSWTAELRMEVFDVAFKRGLSFEQPDVMPTDAKSGVWTAVVPAQTSQFAPPTISRKLVINQTIDPEVAANLLELTHKAGSFGSHLFWDANGAVPSAEIPKRLRSLPSSTLLPLVGECPAA